MDDTLYMERCLQLAGNAAGYTSPNPLVGSVVVHNGRIIGEGWHHRAGEPHAEVNAINSVADPSLLSESTIYVSLEPCAHYGKTPPCADLIIRHKIPKVVIGCRDPFEAVDGKGIEKLEQAGIEVTVGVLEDECRFLNRFFFTYHLRKRPYIILKWAQSQDGFLDKKRERGKKGINWITSKPTKTLVHKWRHEVDAILVGSNTVINDDPELTVRLVSGKSPTRLVVDPLGETPANAKVYNDTASTIAFMHKPNPQLPQRVRTITLSDDVIPSVISTCYEHQVQSLLIEGGAHTLHQFINAGMWDEARVLTGSPHFGEGLKAPTLNVLPAKKHTLGSDQLTLYYNS